MKRQPNQSLRKDEHGVIRFRENAAVVMLYDEACKRGFTLNNLAIHFGKAIPKEDAAQFAQLIGYSLSGFAELSYVTDGKFASVLEETPERLREGWKP